RPSRVAGAPGRGRGGPDRAAAGAVRQRLLLQGGSGPPLRPGARVRGQPTCEALLGRGPGVGGGATAVVFRAVRAGVLQFLDGGRRRRPGPRPAPREPHARESWLPGEVLFFPW